MAQNVGTIYYEVEADTSKLVNSSSAVGRALGRIGRNFADTDRAAMRTEHQMTRTASAVRNLDKSSVSASSSLGGLGRVLGGLLTLQGANQLIQMAEDYNEMAERIRFATSSQEEYELVQQRLLQTANGTYRALAEAQEVYIQTADTLRSLGYSTDQVLDITDSLSYAFVKNSTSVQRAESAMSAFTKAANKGKVEVNGWEAILAAVPSVVNDIAAASGLTAKQVRELGFAGDLTARQLNEGLRRSLDSNKAAADGMQTTVRDATRNMITNLSAYLGEANEATGSTAVMAKAIELLGNNIDTLARILMAAGAGAMARYITLLGVKVTASARAVLAAKAQAAAELALARQHVATTAAALAQAQATVNLSAVSATATAAAAAHTAALVRLRAAQAAAATGFGSLLGVLGGPAGVIALVAAGGVAMATMGREARGAKPSIDQLTDAIDELGAAQLNLRRQQAGEWVEQLAREVREADSAVKALERDMADLNSMKAAGVNIDDEGLSNVNKSYVEAVAEREAVNDRLGKAIEAQDRLFNEQERRRRATTSAGAPAADESDPEVQKRLQALRDELELTKLTGAARARLQALQKLGDKATDAERKEAAALAEEIYRIEQSRVKAGKESKSTATEKARAEEENAKALDRLAQSLREASLEGQQLAVVKARSSLNEFATPEQIARAKELAVAIFKANAETERSEWIADSTGRAQQELFAKHRRWAQEALQLRQITHAEYTKLMKDIDEEARKSTGDMSEFAKQAQRNIQDALGDTLRLSLEGDFKGIAKAWGNMVIQMATEAAAAGLAEKLMGGKGGGGGLFGTLFSSILGGLAGGGGGGSSGVSLVGSTASYGGGRATGGPVAANAMYRINEGGKPEILNTASGKQYLLPNQRGEVVSNRQATAGGGAPGKSSIHIVNQTTGRIDEVQEQYLTADDQVIIVREAVRQVAAEMLNPNSTVSSSMNRAFRIERKR